MKNPFKKEEKPELTEEEKKARKEERKEKIKHVLITTGKVVVGVVAFVGGVLLVAAAVGTDPNTVIESLREGDGDASDPEDVVFVDNGEMNESAEVVEETAV